MLLLRVIATSIYAMTFVAEKAMLWGRGRQRALEADKSSYRVFDVSGVLTVPAGIVLGFTDVGRMRGAGAPWVALAGILLLLCGTALRWTAIATLGEYFTVRVTIFEAHRIVRRGPYKHLRHPSYTGLLLRYFGFGVAYANWLSAALIFLPLLAAVLYRIRVEEDALRQSLGAVYVEYSRTTKRLIPKVY